MISVYGTTFAHVSEISRGMLVRRLAGFHVVVDVKAIEDDGTSALAERRKHDHSRPGRAGRGSALTKTVRWVSYGRFNTCLLAASAYWPKCASIERLVGPPLLLHAPTSTATCGGATQLLAAVVGHPILPAVTCPCGDL